jgi:hypothetical protein
MGFSRRMLPRVFRLTAVQRLEQGVSEVAAPGSERCILDPVTSAAIVDIGDGASCRNLGMARRPSREFGCFGVPEEHNTNLNYA